MADLDTLRALAERLDTHMGKQHVPVLLRDCRAASVGILALLDENERLRERLTEIASQAHNLPRSATADRIDELARSGAHP